MRLSMNPYFFIFGFGYTAQYLAPKISKLGFDIIGTTRKPDGISTMTSSIYHRINFFDPEIENHLAKATHILLSIPPSDEAGDIVALHYVKLIKKYAANLCWLGYLSSTGVYGNHDGKWVNETSLCSPSAKTAILRLNAEQTWISLAEHNQLPMHIFRLAGIYGPQRNALERILAGKKYSIYKKDQVFSRIHVEDIVSVILSSIQAPKPLEIYNVADDEPAPSHIVDAYASKLLNKKPLPLIEFDKTNLSTMEKEFYSNNRRISNQKIKQDLKVTLQYPSYKDGLNKIFKDLQIEKT